MKNNNAKKEPFLIKNSIITPDGTELISKSRHDYVSYKDKNGNYYAVDGGLDYLKRTYDEPDYTENSVYSNAPFALIRTSLLRSSYGKNGDEPLHYILLCDMTNEHLLATIEYEENLEPNSEYLPFYKQEVQHRNENKQ